MMWKLEMGRIVSSIAELKINNEELMERSGGGRIHPLIQTLQSSA
jgi:hypothetical protein